MPMASRPNLTDMISKRQRMYFVDYKIANTAEGIENRNRIHKEYEAVFGDMFKEGLAFRQTHIDPKTSEEFVRIRYRAGGSAAAELAGAMDAIPERFDGILSQANWIRGKNAKGQPTRKVPYMLYQSIDEKIDDQKTLAAVRANAIRNHGTSTTNPLTGRTTTLLPFAAAEDHKDYVAQRTQDINNKKATVAAQVQAAKNAFIPDTPEFKARIQRRLERRIGDEKEQLAWARANPNNSVARGILEKNKKAKSGTALGKVMAGLRTAAIGMVLTAISAAVGTMVKFLSQLPDMAKNLQKVADKGTMYDMTNARAYEYEALAKSIGLEKTAFAEAFGTTYLQGASVTSGNPESFYKSIAPASIQGAGQAIEAFTKYFNPETKAFANQTDVNGNVIRYGVEAVSAAMLNDWFIGAFKGNLVGGTAGETTAFSSLGADYLANNAALAEIGFRLKSRFDSAALTHAQREEIRTTAMKDPENFDILRAMEGYVGGVPTVWDIAGGADMRAAERVAERLAEVLTAGENIKDGILIKIASNLEPLVNWLERIFYAILEILNGSDLFGMKGQFTIPLQTHYNDVKLFNQRSKELNDSVLTDLQPRVEAVRSAYNISPDRVGRILSDLDAGRVPAELQGRSREQIERYRSLEAQLAYASKLDEGFKSASARQGKIRLGGDEGAYSKAGASAAFAMNYEYYAYQAKMAQRYGTLTEDWEHVVDREVLEEANDFLTNTAVPIVDITSWITAFMSSIEPGMATGAHMAEQEILKRQREVAEVLSGTDSSILDTGIAFNESTEGARRISQQQFLDDTWNKLRIQILADTRLGTPDERQEVINKIYSDEIQASLAAEATAKQFDITLWMVGPGGQRTRMVSYNNFSNDSNTALNIPDLIDDYLTQPSPTRQ